MFAVALHVGEAASSLGRVPLRFRSSAVRFGERLQRALSLGTRWDIGGALRDALIVHSDLFSKELNDLVGLLASRQIREHPLAGRFEVSAAKVAETLQSGRHLRLAFNHGVRPLATPAARRAIRPARRCSGGE